MGSLFHIAEVAVLLLLAYTLGWLLGYAARLLASRARTPATSAGAGDAAAAAVAGVAGPAASPVPDAAAAPATGAPSVAAPVAPELPDGLLVGAQATPVASVPVSGLESLKSLATEMPLLPPAEPEASGADTAGAADGAQDGPAPAAPPPPPQAAPDSAEAAPATKVDDEPSRITGPEGQEDAAVIAPPPVVAAVIGSDASTPGQVEAEPDARVGSDDAISPASTATPARVAGMPWSGAMHGRAPEHAEAHPEPRDQPSLQAPVAADAAPDVLAAADDTEQPPAVDPDRAAAPAIVSASGDDNEREPLDSEASVGPDGAPLATIAVEHPPVLPASELAAMNPAPEVPIATRKATEPAISATTPDGPASLEPTLIPQTSPEPLGPRQAVPGPESTTAAPEPVHGEVDEDAAMRAIEGGWSRRDARALPDAPELTDLTAAVSAAQMAVEQVLARNGVAPADGDTREQLAFGRPRGLPHARNGGRDDLKQISGLGPLDESALNNLGIYHFDQVAGWTEREVLWLENHAFARGRIGRERWQAQARALAGGDAVLTARR